MKEVIDLLKRYTNGKQNTDKVEISVLQLSRVIKALEQEPCEDAISRQAVIDLVVANHTELNGVNVVMYSPLYKDIKQLSPVTPQSKTDVLDKIREEIVDAGAYEQEVNGMTEFLKGITYCLRVIDEYREE